MIFRFILLDFLRELILDLFEVVRSNQMDALSVLPIILQRKLERSHLNFGAGAGTFARRQSPFSGRTLSSGFGHA
jgi:hypothetical protein